MVTLLSPLGLHLSLDIGIDSEIVSSFSSTLMTPPVLMLNTLIEPFISPPTESKLPLEPIYAPSW